MPKKVTPMAIQHQVVVTPGVTAHSVRVHHRDIPELRADGESPESAAVNLAQDLAREIDGLADDRRRNLFQQASSDVQCFIDACLRS